VQLPELPELPEIFDRRWVRITTLCAIVLLIALLTGYFVLRYLESSTLACQCEGEVDSSRLALFNPFRDRVPEKTAETAMQRMQQHQCQAFPGPAIYCSEEDHLNILSWKLTGYIDDGTSANLRFWIVRSAKQGDPFGDPLWMTLRRNGKSWTITKVDTFY
jgi:hypothetical protein